MHLQSLHQDLVAGNLRATKISRNCGFADDVVDK